MPPACAMNDFRAELNPGQHEVVQTTEGPVLVIAGAGSGKTRVIEYRVLNLIQKKVPPQSILLLTFTRRAAEQMLSRACRHDPRARFVQGGTFHSFAYGVLKKYGSLLGFDSFTILDEDDAQEALYLCAKNLSLVQADKTFPKKDTLRKIVGMAVNKEKSVRDVVESQYPQFSEVVPQLERVKNEYIRYKLAKGYFDYEDLLEFTKTLFVKNEAVRREVAQKFRYIMVDEYQDTNRLQADITYLLGKDHGNVMAVGDDAQSIYGFRGATHQNIMDFPRQFKDCRILKLEANYRSHQQILDVANQVLSEMKHKFSKHLVSASEKQGERPALVFFRDGFEEAEWLARSIAQARDEGTALHHQAVLFRSAYVSIPLQVALSRMGIPFAVYGGLKFYESAHVKDLVSHCKVLVNPRDELAWLRVLMLLEGVGAKTAARIVEQITKGQRGLEGVLAKEKSPRTCGQLSRLNAALAARQEPSCAPQDVVCGFIEYYLPILKQKFDDWDQRVYDLEALKLLSGRYVSMTDFLADFALDPPDRGQQKEVLAVSEKEKPLVLSTIHSAKGLEWERVYLIGLVEGMLPVSFSLHDDDGIEEERRLFYVAVTRARHRLTLSVHHQAAAAGGFRQYNTISRFLDSERILAHLNQDVYCDEHE